MSDKSRFFWSDGGPAHVWNSYQEMLDYDAANPDLDDGEAPVDPAPAPPTPPAQDRLPLRHGYRTGRRHPLRVTGGSK